jgi:hypothetical protein
LGNVETDLGHGRLEVLPVLRGLDGIDAGADELDAVGLEHASLVETDGEVERGLTAEGGQEGVGPLPLDDRRQHVNREGLDVGPMGEVGVGHDRRRVGVGEDDLVALGLEHPTGLGPGVIELRRLADHDGTGPDEEDGLDVVAAGHQWPCSINSRNWAKR